MLYFQKNTIKPTIDSSEIKEQVRGFYQDVRKYPPDMTGRLFTWMLASASLLKNNILQHDEIFNHPDAIDNAQYWRDLFRFGKFLPIAQNIGWAESERSVKKTVMRGQMPYRLRMFELFDTLLAKKTNVNVLEIGPGYGWHHKHFERRYRRLDLKIHAIDYAVLYKHPRLHQTDGKTFPPGIPEKFDLIYSINCFQHLSFKQKDLYYREIAERLFDDGAFFFSDFCLTDEMRRTNSGIKTREGRAVMTFATQLNDMYESFDEMRKHMDENGLRIEGYSHTLDSQIYLVATKKSTKAKKDIDTFFGR